MKKINVKVKVSGGTAPVSIKIDITNLKTQKNKIILRDESFSEDFILESGTYFILISGMNPINGTTEIKLSGDFAEESIYRAKRVTKLPLVAELFKVKI